ncbi:hypothetical protein FSP39_018303 [Pinctada imbricata]|uniref:Uncoordinated protein 79 n=1 Tax=Pinctada imbricata TaxID=66713 RepID=A0AA88Y7E8_PINIB|nr:hypothetical protein FSP39_018303 [Pinctada imbricata]
MGHNGDINYPTGNLNSSDKESEHFLRKLNRARFALARTDSIRSLSIKPPYRRAVSVPVHLVTKTVPAKVEQVKEKSYIRQQSAPHFSLARRMTSKMNLGSTFSNIFPGGSVKEFTDDESNFTALLQRAMDMEGVDKDTVYKLVALLMKFMVTSTDGEEDKRDTKTQNVVLRHLNVLLGYNQTEKSFSVPPHKLRLSAVFNAFLSGVPFVLDRNFELGNQILPITLLLLQYGPSPQRYATDYQPPNYTLWYLEPHTRISWLTTLLVILYKYQFYTSPVSAIIQTLIRVVINTIDAQHHRCKKARDESFVPPSPSVLRGKDSTKMNNLENIQETDTPPQSPKTKEQTVELNMKPLSEDSSVKYTPVSEDSESTPPIKEQTIEEVIETPNRPQPRKQPRRIIEYSEPDMELQTGQGDSKWKSSRPGRVEAVSPRSKSPVSPQGLRSLSPATIDTSPASEKAPVVSPTVDSVIAKQLHEFSHKDKDAKASTSPVGDSRGNIGLKAVASGRLSQMSSSFTDASSSRDGATTTTESHDGQSEIESAAEDSEKTQTTSDAESEKHGGATDSGDADTQEDETSKLLQSGRGQGSKPNFRQRKARKTGLMTVELQKLYPELNEPVSEDTQAKPSGRRARKSELLTKGKAAKKIPVSRYGENVMVERCSKCNAILEQYDEDTIGYCIIVLATFIHREPSLATPLLLETLQCVTQIASSNPYVWQTDSYMMVPGNSVSIARQFLRCVLHQLAPNGIFPMLFQSNFEDIHFFKTMAAALVDFPELTCHAPIQFLLEGLNNRKNLPSENIMVLLDNLSNYMNCISLETSAPMWTSILWNFELFLRKLPLVLPNPCDTGSLLKIMTSILKVSGISNARSILEPFSKLLSFTIQNCPFKLQQVLDMCSLCNRVFTKERDKLYLTRTVIFELVQAIKFKQSLPDANFLLLLQFVVLDAGGTIGSTNIVSDMILLYNNQTHMLMSTCAAECMRDHLHECLEFVADLHTLTKIKNNMKSGTSSLNEDTLGNQLKSGIAQFVALEITRGNGRDNRAISRYLPWLYHPPSTVQQGPKEFTDCIGHIRLLSWLLIGSLTHIGMTEGTAPITCQPIPLDASSYIAEHVLVIMTGFDERKRLWTMYCESSAAQYPVYSENHRNASNMVMDFWGRVTPGILQMLSASKELAEMVNLHFLSLMEALRECNSSVLAKLFPMWTSILFTYHSPLPGHLQVRLQTVENWDPPSPSKGQASFNAAILLTWLKRIQFKFGQIEVQSSAATQFYTV